MGIAVGVTTIATEESIFSRLPFSDDYKTLYRNDGASNFPMLPIGSVCRPNHPFFGLGKLVSSILTMTACWTFSSSTVQCTRKWDRQDWGQPGGTAAALPES